MAKDLNYVDYKDTEYLQRFINEQGKILPRRVTNTSAKTQRQITRAVKRARHLALISSIDGRSHHQEAEATP